MLNYLNVLEGVGHHGNEHVDKHNNGHGVVNHKQMFPHLFRELLHRPIPHGVQLRQAEQCPKQRCHAAAQSVAHNIKQGSDRRSITEYLTSKVTIIC